MESIGWQLSGAKHDRTRATVTMKEQFVMILHNTNRIYLVFAYLWYYYAKKLLKSSP